MQLRQLQMKYMHSMAQYQPSNLIQTIVFSLCKCKYLIFYEQPHTTLSFACLYYQYMIGMCFHSVIS